MITHEEDKNILKCNQDKKNFEDESLHEKIHTLDKNLEESFTTQISKRRRTAIHYLQTVHLIVAKANTIFTEMLTA